MGILNSISLGIKKVLTRVTAEGKDAGIWFGKKGTNILTEDEIKEFIKKHIASENTDYLKYLADKMNGVPTNIIANPNGRLTYGGTVPSVGGVEDIEQKFYQTLFNFNQLNGDPGSRFQNQIFANIPTNNPTNEFVPFGTTGRPENPTRIVKKPVEVKDELTYEPYEHSMEDIDGKIAMCEKRLGFASQLYADSELRGMIERLKNRKKYDEFKEFFGQFPNTTDEKIENLLTKYDLVIKPTDIFIGDFPDDAIETMKAYKEQVIKLTGQQPVFRVIAETSAFQQAYKKKDPILLAQSPFGFYWQVLGAWSDEMLLLSEL